MKAKTFKRIGSMLLAVLLFASVSGLASAVTLDKTFTFYMVPNAHIDTAWQWPYQHTADTIIRDTYGNMIAHMKTNETYRFSTSASKHYEYADEYYPAYWADLQVLVKNGQWDITGGQIIEPDLNLTSGESLARQGLYAQHYFEEKFGKAYVPVTAFVPDTFGFQGQFPQIIKKTGMDFFVTSKLNWNDTDYTTNNRESDIQWWQALDGSKVLTYILCRDYPSSDWSTSNIQNAFDRNWKAGSSTEVKTAMGFYGSGDHGGGPSLAGFSYPAQRNGQSAATVKMASCTQYFQETVANENLDKVPIHQGEYYFEYHRGTYTTWSRVKKYNRQNEILADAAEKAATLSYWTGGTTTNSMDTISLAWDKILINQMHDVLPGSAAPYAYYVAFNNHELAKNLLTNTENSALYGLAYRADTNTAGAPVFVYNALAWPRSDDVTVTLSYADALPAAVSVRDGEIDLPTKVVSRDEAAKKLVVSFRAANVPALGYKVFSAVSLDVVPPYDEGVTYNAETMVMENHYLKVTFNPATGNIKSLINKQDGNREMFVQNAGTEGNELHAYVDTGGGSWPAWDLVANEMNREPQYILNDTPTITVLENTGERVTLRISRTWLDSYIAQDVTLSASSNKVDVKLGVDWRQSQRLLKVSFPILADADQANYETGYGAVSRPTTRDNAYGSTRFEVPGHKWMDVTDRSGSFGLSLLNDAKYGYDSLKKTAEGQNYIRSRITVVRSPMSGPLSYSQYQPSPHYVDLGYQEFNYAIYPHTSGWEAAETVNKAYELATPMTAFQTVKHSGALPGALSFLSVDKKNVIVSTVKNPYDAPEDKNTFIVRMYEATGKDTAGVTLTMPSNVVSAKEVNMLEHDYDGHKAVTVSGSNVTFDIGHYEALTLEVKIAGYTEAPYELAQVQVDLASFFNLDGVSSDSNRRDGNLDGKGNTVPERNWPSEVNYQGVKFRFASSTGATQNNYVEAVGQSIPLPAGHYNKLFLVGVAAGANASTGDFIVKYSDDTSTVKNLTFADWHSDLSGWDRFAKADLKPYTLDSVAYVFTHYHDGVNDQMTLDNYLFVYSIDLDSTKTTASVTLPNAPGIKLAAMTVANCDVDGYADVFDRTGASANVAAPTNLVATAPGDTSTASLTWTASTTPDIGNYVIYRGLTENFALSDITYLTTVSGMMTSYVDSPSVRRTFYYKIIAVTRNGVSSPASLPSNGILAGMVNYCLTAENVTAVNWVNNNERPAMACDGSNSTKWCTTGIMTANNRGYLTVQLVPEGAEPVKVEKFLVAHGGVSESTTYNTRNFNIDYSLDGQTWVNAVQARNNNQSTTTHPMTAPIPARYVRLLVINGEQGSSNTARIYEFQALGFDNIVFKPAASGLALAVDPKRDGSVNFTGNYTFTSKDIYAEEGASTYQWSLFKNGAYEPIAGATAKTLSLTQSVLHGAEALKFEVTPVDSFGVAGLLQSVELKYNTVGANVLRGKTLIGSSGQVSANESAEMLVDGSGTTKWCQENVSSSSPSWATYDLGATYMLDSFKLFHSASNKSAADYDKQNGINTRDFDILTSIDGKHWKTAVGVRGNWDEITTHTLAQAVPARFVKLVVITPNSGLFVNPTIDGQQALRIWEFEGYGQFVEFGSIVDVTLSDEILADAAGDDLKADVFVSNFTGTADKTVAVIAALYDVDGSLENVTAETKTIAVGAGEDFAVSLAIPAVTAGKTYKIFIWDGATMVPLVSEIIVT